MAGLSEGKRLQDRYALEDPSERLGGELAESFAQRHALALTTFVEADELASLPPTQAHGAAPELPPRPRADLALEVRTAGWSIASTLGSPPVVQYTAWVTLTDTKSDAVLAKGECRVDRVAAAPSLDDLVANGAARLKRELSLLANRCGDKLSQDLLFAPIATQPARMEDRSVRPATAAATTPSGPVPQRADDE